MKKKLIQVLKTLYASKGFKANELEELADVLSSSLKEDSTDEEISNVANGAESYVNMLQKVGNRYASAIEEKYKGYNGLKGVKQTIEIKDGKVVQDLEVDFSVASISELRKALPEEYSGIGNRVSFSNSKKALEKMGFTEKTN